MFGVPVVADDGLLCFRYQGSRFTLRMTASDCLIFNEVVLQDAYRIDSLPDRLGTVVDLGGNIGLFAARVAPRADRVICVEPVKSNLEIAKRNVSEFGGKVRMHELALSGESGQRLRLNLSDHPWLHSAYRQFRRRNGEDREAVEVETISLADLFALEGIETCTLLKCDVEGAEYDTFLATPIEVLERIEAIVMEVHLRLAPAFPGRWPELRQHLEAAGLHLEVDGDESPPGDGPASFMVRATRSEARSSA